jgi:hypothetical protein
MGGVLSACTSQSVTGELSGEMVCPDFQVGMSADILKGSLRFPVQVKILEDDEPRWGRVVLGKRIESEPNTKFVIEDDDETYEVVWAQCVNHFAPKRVDFNDPNAERGSGYQCGDAQEYARAKLEIRAGDVSSRVIGWVAPPDTSCWASMYVREDGTPLPIGSASSSAAPPEPSAAPSAAPSADPSAQPAASASASASAAVVAPPSSAPKAPAPPKVPAPAEPKSPPPKSPAPKQPAPPAPKQPAPPAPAPPPPPAPPPLPPPPLTP